MKELIKQYFCKHIWRELGVNCAPIRDEFGFFVRKGFSAEKCSKCNKVRLK